MEVNTRTIVRDFVAILTIMLWLNLGKTISSTIVYLFNIPVPVIYARDAQRPHFESSRHIGRHLVSATEIFWLETIVSTNTPMGLLVWVDILAVLEKYVTELDAWSELLLSHCQKIDTTFS